LRIKNANNSTASASGATASPTAAAAHANAANGIYAGLFPVAAAVAALAIAI
jgi:hypothetical protein